MKDARQWIHELDANETGVAVCTDSEIRAIQIDALKEGLQRFAWWKDGTQYVGTCGTTLKQALKDAENL